MAGGRIKGKDYSDRPWEEIQHRYEFGEASPKILSELYNIPVQTITTRAKRLGWTRPRTTAIKTGGDTPAKTAAMQLPKLWGEERITKAVQSISNWFDDLEEGDNLTIADFCRSKYNVLNIRPTQMIHLFTIPAFREQWDMYKPLIAERIAKGAYTLKNGKSTPLSIFWLKQFGWTDRQEITTIDAGASIDAAISRAYDVTPKK